MAEPILLRWLTENVADTRAAGPPGPRRYVSSFARTWDVLLETARGRRGWRVRRADEGAGRLEAVCRTPVLRFRDDLVVWVTLDRDGLTRVDARSSSRVGVGDLGTNARRIRRLWRSLDRRLVRVREAEPSG